MKTQAIAFDLDDTLLRDDLTVSGYTISVLREARERGIRIIPASGRARDSMKGFVEQLGCVDLFIACNGAEVWHADGTLVMRKRLEQDTLLEIARFGAERGVYAQTYDGPYFYYNQEGHYARAYAAQSKLTGVLVGDLEAYLSTHASSKVLMMSDEKTIADMLQKAREQFAGRVSVTCSKPYFLEFNPLDATKGNALAYCAEKLHFDIASSVAFGDSLNDLPTLTRAGLGVAMGNAREDVKALIPVHCLSNMDDGVARFVHDNILTHTED